MEVKLIKRYNADYAKNVLIIGVVHGDEPQGEYFINRYLEQNFAGKNNMFYIPRLNLSSTRKNKNGVDLNRNFPTGNWRKTDKNDDYYGGEEPASEYETKFLINILEKVKFDAAITIHSPYKIINYDGPGYYLSNEISKILDYPLQKEIGYDTFGSFGTYCGIERNIPTVTIECAEDVEPKILYPKFKNLFEYLENADKFKD
ncbi:MAG: hypothetical protein LUE64_03945 [Candidatus Gastranaerophilales bacterium]|nr:hypothetical protein [Candidatus Gastranaerophilales bacterium]